MLFTRPLLTTAYFPPVEYFFVLANCSSAVIEACESYQKQSYRNRCRIYATGGVENLSVPVVHSAADAPISATEIDYSRNWLHQHCLAIRSAYGSSPFFEYYWDELEAILRSRPRRLIDLNLALTEQIAEMIGLRCSISLSESYTPVMPAPGDCHVAPLLAMTDGRPAKTAENDPSLRSLEGGSINSNQASLRKPENQSTGDSGQASLRSLEEAVAISRSQQCYTDLRSRIHPKHKGASLMEEQGAIKEYYQVFSDRCGFIPNLSILDLLFHEGPQSGEYLTPSY